MKTFLKILMLIKLCSCDYSSRQCIEKRIIKQHNEDDYIKDIKVILLILQKCRNTFNVEIAGLQKVPQRTFHYSKETKEIKLSGNDIEEIQQDTFKGLCRVEQLDLSLNKIRSVSSLMFSDLNHLNILNLSMNSLETIINIDFPRSVGIIDFSWNNLDNRQKNIFNSLKPFEVRKNE